MTVDVSTNIVKSGNDLASALMEFASIVRLGITIDVELALKLMELAEVALTGWQEAVAPEEEV